MPPAPPVGTGFSPLDARLGLRPGTHFSPWLVDSIVRLGARLPFGQVPELVAHFTGVRVGVETVRRLTEAAGTAAVTVAAAEVGELFRHRIDSPLGPPLQQLSVDGAMAPLVGGAWAEVKTVALGVVTTGADGAPATTDLSYFSRLADAETFGVAATGELHRRGTTTAQTVVAITDGAVWCQGFIDLHRPDAVRILDFPHALEHLGAVAQAVWGRGTPDTSAWLGVQAAALRHGREAQAVTAVAALGARPELSAAAQDTIRQTVAYFAAREGQIRYQAFTDAGYPIGSGCVESANKLVMEARLKGAGMHWVRTNVNPMLALRTLVANERWTEGWPMLWDQWRQPLRPPPTPTVGPVPPAPFVTPPPVTTTSIPRPKTIVNGKPTADHPWRRSSPFRAKR